MLYGSVSRNDVILLHRLAMSRIRSLLGVCGLLRGLYQTDEALCTIGDVEVKLRQARDLLEDLCPYDAPIKAEGIF